MIALIAALARWTSVRRATRVDPATVLRAEQERGFGATRSRQSLGEGGPPPLHRLFGHRSNRLAPTEEPSESWHRWHTYQVLTKRGDRLQAMLAGKLKAAARQSHIWWGVSVEDRTHGLPRVAELRDSQARVRFLSIEPLLEDLGRINLRGIHWVIVGGESGPGARPMSAEWVRGIKDQCKKASIPFFFKQWGGVRKSETGRELDGHTYSQFPERDEATVPGRSERALAVQEFEIAYQR